MSALIEMLAVGPWILFGGLGSYLLTRTSERYRRQPRPVADEVPPDEVSPGVPATGCYDGCPLPEPRTADQFLAPWCCPNCDRVWTVDKRTPTLQWRRMGRTAAWLYRMAR